MGSSDSPGARPDSCAPAQAAAFNLRTMAIDEPVLREFRRELYHSAGPGYCVFPGFIDATAVAHVRAMWSTIEPAMTHQQFLGRHQFFVQCPDYFQSTADGNRVFFNFFWNPPLDELTYTASLYVQVLRNRISGRLPFSEVFPYGGKSASYRVIITRLAKTWVEPHRDYFNYERRFEKNRYDLSRLQATLILSEKGVDYGGTGFRFEQNSGRTVIFGTDVAVKPGDLVIWRYNNLHSVEDVVTAPGQVGFMRIVYPPEDISPSEPVPGWRERIHRLAGRGRRVARRMVGSVGGG